MASLGGFEACHANRRQAALRRRFAPKEGVVYLWRFGLVSRQKNNPPQKKLGNSNWWKHLVNLNCYLYNHSNSLNAGKEKELTQKTPMFLLVFLLNRLKRGNFWKLPWVPNHCLKNVCYLQFFGGKTFGGLNIFWDNERAHTTFFSVGLFGNCPGKITAPVSIWTIGLNFFWGKRILL